MVVSYVFILCLISEPEVLDLTETSCRIVWSAYRLPVSSDSVIYLVEVTRTKESQEPVVVLTFCRRIFKYFQEDFIHLRNRKHLN